MPKPHWFGGWERLGYLVGVRIIGAVLANVLIWTQFVLYPACRSATSVPGARSPPGPVNVCDGGCWSNGTQAVCASGRPSQAAFLLACACELGMVVIVEGTLELAPPAVRK